MKSIFFFFGFLFVAFFCVWEGMDGIGLAPKSEGCSSQVNLVEHT